MKVYVLVYIFDDGSCDGRPEATTSLFTTMDAAKEAMQNKIAEIKADNNINEDSIDEGETSFWCFSDDQHRYGLADGFKLEIHEDEIN